MDYTVPPGLVEKHDAVTAGLIASRLRWLAPVLVGIILVDGVLEIFDWNLSTGRWLISVCIRAVAIALLLCTRYLAGRLTRLRPLRMLGYALVVLLYATVVALGLIYPKPVNTGASIYIGIMLISCFLLPWHVKDTLAISAMAMVGYTIEAWKEGFPGGWEPYAMNLFFVVLGAFLAAVVKRDDERRRRHEFLLQTEIEEKNRELERDLELARRIHLSLIPKSVVMNEAEVAVTYSPMSYVGGDYANFLFAKEGRLVFFMSDVAGHGVSAALVANRIHSEVERLMKEPMGPGELLHQLDGFVTGQLADTSMFLSAVSGVLDFKQKKLVYSNHGHPPQILYQTHEGKLRLMKPISPLLGLGIPGPPPEESEADLPFNAGDRIILFTDGVTETQGKDEELFGFDRLKEFATRHGSLPPEQFNAALTNELSSFRDGPIQEDDIFILTIQVR